MYIIARQNVLRLLIGFVVLITFIASSIVVFSNWYENRVASHRLVRTHQLTEVAFALQRYKEKHGHFPPPVYKDVSTGYVHSWRILLLEVLDEELHRQYRYNEPWNSTYNLSLAEDIAKYYRFQSEELQSEIVAIVDSTTLFPLVENNSTVNATYDPAMTILVVECYNSGIHVLEPRDLNFTTMSFQVNDRARDAIRGPDATGAMAVMANGQCLVLPENMPADRLQSMLTIR